MKFGLIQLDCDPGSCVISSSRGESSTCNDARNPPAAHDHQDCRDQERADHDPMKRQAEMRVAVVDTGHEAVLVPHHLKAVEVIAGGERYQQERSGYTQKQGFQAAG